ncbi:MAG: hypothetical protein LN415_00885 [Candidatus Thermoplasmatota archaeon]|nr:hypothetical protein [Candidatus Thermoplasmatota archaeon]
MEPSRRAFRIKRKLKWDNKGVASTVGTIMALMVVMTFFSMIVNQYVPVWMKDAESAHMNEVYGQFGTLKGSVDLQVLSCVIMLRQNEPCMRSSGFTPIEVGIDGVPIFSAPTVGELTGREDRGKFSVNFSYQHDVGGTNETFYVKQNASGNIVLEVANRYFVRQTLTYEGGAIIRSQEEGEVIKGEPSFMVSKKGDYVEIWMYLIDLYGDGSVGGIGTQGVHHDLNGASWDEYSNVNSDVTIVHWTQNGKAWYKFFNETLSSAFGVTEQDYEDNSPPDWDWYGSGAQEKATNPYFVVKRTVFDDYSLIEVTIESDDVDIGRLTLVSSNFDVVIGETSSRT